MNFSLINEFESAALVVNDKHAALKLINHVMHVAIPPFYLDNISKYIGITLTGQLQIYNNELKGVPVAFNKQKIKLLSQYGRIMPGQSNVHTDFSVEVIIFAPKIGDKLKALVHKLNPKSFGCLVHGYFYVSVKYEFPNSDQQISVNLEDEVFIKVIKLDEDGNGYLSIYGEYVSSKSMEIDSGIDEEAINEVYSRLNNLYPEDATLQNNDQNEESAFELNNSIFQQMADTNLDCSTNYNTKVQHTSDEVQSEESSQVSESEQNNLESDLPEESLTADVKEEPLDPDAQQINLLKEKLAKYEKKAMKKKKRKEKKKKLEESNSEIVETPMKKKKKKKKDKSEKEKKDKSERKKEKKDKSEKKSAEKKKKSKKRKADDSTYEPSAKYSKT